MTGPSMIERVARILCGQDLGDPDAIIQGEGSMAATSYRGWVAYTSNAKTILASMREPTSLMQQAGFELGSHREPAAY